MTSRASGVAAVTGAAQGIGLAISRRLASDGWLVAGLDRDHELMGSNSKEAGIALALEADVTDPASIKHAFAEVESKLGPLTGLVCNAGVAGRAAPIQEQSDADWDLVVGVDLKGVFICCRAAIPGMVARGYGRIVNVSSISGKEGNPNMVPYSSAKAGVLGLTKALAKEVAGSGVLVNAVTPAVVQTRILDTLTEKQVDYMTSRIPLGRTALPEEVAAAVAWLMSEEASFTTGSTLDVSGGRATY